jgi:predicted phage terminase large subunit-like protein
MSKAGFVEQLQAIRTMVARYPECKTRLIERKAAGESLLQLLQKENPWIPVDPRESKAQRLAAQAPTFESKAVFFPSQRLAKFNVPEIIHQVITFPAARHDDAVDTLCYALAKLSDGSTDLAEAMRNVRLSMVGKGRFIFS